MFASCHAWKRRSSAPSVSGIVGLAPRRSGAAPRPFSRARSVPLCDPSSAMHTSSAGSQPDREPLSRRNALVSAYFANCLSTTASQAVTTGRSETPRRGSWDVNDYVG